MDFTLVCTDQISNLLLDLQKGLYDTLMYLALRLFKLTEPWLKLISGKNKINPKKPSTKKFQVYAGWLRTL